MRVPRTKRRGHGVCCWRFVRLEAGGGYEAEEDHTPCAPRVYMRSSRRASVLLALSSPAHCSSSFLPSSQVRLCSLLLAVPPDFFFHVRPLCSLPDLFLFLRSLRPICCFFLVPIVPPDFIYRETDRESYLSRVFLATGIAGRSRVPGLTFHRE